MSHRRSQSIRNLVGFPRVSGDEPTYGIVTERKELFSPRERG